jgi:hypothetical protein
MRSYAHARAKSYIRLLPGVDDRAVQNGWDKVVTNALHFVELYACACAHACECECERVCV